MAKRDLEQSRENRTLSRIPFRRKIDMLVALPTVALVALLAPVTVHEVQASRQWSSSARYLSDTKPISILIEDLSIERERAEAALSGGDAATTDYLTAVGATDRQAVAAAGAFGADPPPAISAALAAIDALSYVRTQTPRLSFDETPAETQTLVYLNYGKVVSQLVDALNLRGEGGQGGPASTLDAELGALYQADVAENQREAALVAFAGTNDQSNAVLDYTDAVQQSEVAGDQRAEFQKYASTQDTAAMMYVTAQPENAQFDTAQNDIGTAIGNDMGTQHTVAQAQVVAALLDGERTSTKIADLTQDFESLSDRRAAMESAVTDEVVGLADRNSSDASWTAAALLGAAAATFLMLLGLSILIRHSVVRPVLRLTHAASRVARAAAADLERVADEDPGQHTPMPEFEALPVPTGDELGALAEAFNQVQETALLVLERQLTIRRNTAEMFGNVGHRIHNLTDRQLALIDQVERSEADPELLDRMYRIDHLAVRLQRGADSLILLSGEREANLSGAPMRLTDVVRSAVGRVEGYQRAVLIAEDDAMVVPAAISDLTLMIAELVENAVAFSPASSRVEIAVGLTHRGFAVEIVDRGMGMTADQLAAENTRLVRRERLDLAPTRVLGLFVVGRLSQRTGAAVELAPTPGGGITARIFVPGFLLAGQPQEPLPQRNGAQQLERIVEPMPATLTRAEVTRSDGLGRRRATPALDPTPSSQVPEPRRTIEPLPRRRAVPISPPATPAPPVAPAAGPTGPVNPLTVPSAWPMSSALPPRRPMAPQPTPPPTQPPPPPQVPATYTPPRPATPVPPSALTPSSADSALPRRIRNATPPPEWAANKADALSATTPAPHQDAVAVRDALEEFEAGVEQAHRESADDLPTRRRSQARHAGATPHRDDDLERRTKP